MREINIALASGILFFASYFSLQSHYLSDSGDGTRLRAFSTTQSKQQQQKAAQNIFLLSDEQITKQLRNLEESYYVNRGKGVVRYDISQLPSNSPIEDDRSEAVVTVPTKDGNTDFYFWGIYDGHSGYYTSLKLRDELISHVVHALGAEYKQDPEDPSSGARLIPTPEVIDEAIKRGFLHLDHEIVQEGLTQLFEDPNNKERALRALPAASGACGLLTFYDSSSQLLRVAVTGDSRAVLGSLNADGQWTAKSLSVDQTGDNPEEVERIKAEHPGEATCVRNGRVLGSLQPTRAFGDFRYKLKEINGKAIDSLPEHLKVYFRSPPKNSLTPPYVTAEPVVTTTKIDPSKRDFVVIGSDGLYELLSNEEIVGLVVKWMEKNSVTKTKTPTSTEEKRWSGLFSGSDDKKLPRVLDVSDEKYRDFQRPAFRNKKVSEQHEYLLEDTNVSTHLIRNALSLGGSKEYVSTLVSIPSPTSRKYRDDLTVTVVFFGDGTPDDAGKLEVNIPATKNGLAEEAKL
ncbi:CYFA0S01e18338g1_1 [Cyberlindnera fabianii]|nr:CYFA0S01e18338g1_1 [Cyberlindnera fabianii]